MTRPLLKWAGGKRQLLPQLRRFYPAQFNRYIEPFFGSGAVFFDLHRSRRVDTAILIDSNADLIGCYEAVRDRPHEVADALDALAAGHARRGRDHYYDVRDRRFNPARLQQAGERPVYTPELAAMLIYLNRTGFNGLFRVNARGGFNVPAGRYVRPRIADRERLLQVSAALAAPGVELRCGSFELADLAQAGDFLYIDPPYAPVTRTSHFTAYTAPGFDAERQQQLQRLVLEWSRRGCFVLLSNSTAGEIARLYDRNPAARAAGLRAMRVPARRSINSVSARRGAVEEYLITNVELQDCRTAGLQD